MILMDKIVIGMFLVGMVVIIATIINDPWA